MTKKNIKKKAPSWDDFVQDQMQDPEFALAYQIEFDKLQLARKLKNLREISHISQTDLAHMVGTKQPAIARLESGKVTPKLDLLEKIAFALGRTLDIRFTKKSAI
jgi:DNA-binding XRE family transcriptional regulator